MKTLVFDNHNSYWDEDEKYNILLLNSRVVYFEDMLKADGIVLFIDVIKSLGYSPRDFSIEDLTKYWLDCDYEEFPMKVTQRSDENVFDIQFSFKEDVDG